MKKVVCVLVILSMLFNAFTVLADVLEETHVKVITMADTYTQQGEENINKNFGSDDLIVFKASESTSVNRRVYLKFDISSLTADNLSNAKIMLERVGGEGFSNGPSEVPVRAFAVGDFDEYAITHSTGLVLGKVVGVGYSTKHKETVSVDITEYVREEILKGTQIINVALYDRLLTNRRIDFASRETDTPPYLDVKYGGTPDPIEPFDDGLGSIEATEENAIKNAKMLLAKSNATYLSNVNTEEITKVSEKEYHVIASEDSYVRGGQYSDSNYGDDVLVITKSNNAAEQGQYHRTAFFKFKISVLNQNQVGGAFVKLYLDNDEGSNDNNLSAYEIDPSLWDEKTLTWNNQPPKGELISSVPVSEAGCYTYLNLTDYVNKKSLEGVEEISFSLFDDNKFNKNYEFSSRETLTPPVLMLAGIGDEPHSAKLPSTVLEEEIDDYEYIYVDTTLTSKPSETYYPTKTRVISSLTDYTPVTEKPEVSKYGGLLSKQYEATGFFRCEQIDGRWWMIDPLGHPLFTFAFNSVSFASTEKEKAGLEEKFGTEENWAKETKKLFEEMNVYGMTGSKDKFNEYLGENKMPYFDSLGCIGSYGKLKDMITSNGGSTVFRYNVMPVFDPQFEYYVDTKARVNVTKRKDDPYLIGWFADNEITVTPEMLYSYLTVDPNNEDYIYSYHAAWEWFKARHGEDATIEDITAKDQDDFREYVFDRYYSVVANAIRKYDPNHMYMGSRLNGNARTSRGIFAAAGRYLDCITFNYYGTWTPRETDMENWYNWSGGKPFFVTEQYTKGMDATEKVPGLTNESGAGWVVKTQEDRGNFYQNYALGLIEYGTCIGFKWYKYSDNDPDGPQTDVSNLNSNKGIIDRDYNYHTDLIEKMTELNRNVFGLAEYFDAKNNVGGQSLVYKENITNTGEVPIECKMILAIYDAATNSLVDVTVGNRYVVGVGNNVDVQCTIEDVSDLEANNYYIKAYVWNENLLNPISDSQIVK